MDNIVIHITNGWYDFTKLDQSKNYKAISQMNFFTYESLINRGVSFDV